MGCNTMALTIHSSTICFRGRNPTWLSRNTKLTSVDFTTIFVIQQRQHPVFFLEIKAAEHLRNKSTRAAADKQMRERFEDLGDHVEMYGVSAIGTKLCFYKYTKDTEPELILGHTKIVVDTAPKERWEFDVLIAEGERKFREVVGEVKRMCEQPSL